MGSTLHRLMLLGATIAVLGCDSPTSPSPPPPPPPPPPPIAPGTLAVTTFTTTGLLVKSAFHYQPTLIVTAGANGSAVQISSVTFERPIADGGLPLHEIHYPVPVRVQPGRTHDLSAPALEIVTNEGLDGLRVRVAFVDLGDRAGLAVADTAVPLLSAGLADVELAISDFHVEVWTFESQHHYWPSLTVAETSGRGPARIVNLVFDLLDGTRDRFVPTFYLKDVPAGGRIAIDGDSFGWFEFISKSYSQRMSVVITFADSSGRVSSVAAIAKTN